MNIAFVANGKKTEFFYQIGLEIQKTCPQVDIYFICSSSVQYDIYLNHGVQKNKLLLINWSILNRDSKPIGEYKLNEIAGYDRGLKNCFEDGIRYLKNMQEPFFNFVSSNNLKYIFGEMTWSPEVLMARICQDKFKGSCAYLHPQSIRIPNGRFCFMDTEFQDSLYPITEYCRDKEILSNFDLPVKPVVPQRVADVAADVKQSMGFSRRFRLLMNFLILRNFEKPKKKDSLQGYQLSKWGSRKKTFRTEWNKFYYMNFVKKATWDDIKDKHYLFVTLHMQPEASVDVVGRYYDDQLKNIENLWRILPEDYYIVVKEHTNAIGNRGRAFFKKLMAMKNIIVIDENISSHKILNSSEGVFTNSGTVALESGLYSKHAFLFSGIFFDKLKFCHKVTLDDFKYTNSFFELRDKCIARDENKMDLNTYSEYILRSSFEGIIDPHQTSPLYEDRDNIQTIAKSFSLFLSL